MLGDAHSHLEIDYLNLLTCLEDCRILICERELNGRTVDRWLVHSECNDELKYLEQGERIIVRRAVVPAARK